VTGSDTSFLELVAQMTRMCDVDTKDYSFAPRTMAEPVREDVADQLGRIQMRSASWLST
jgi:hypothetical protein